MNTGLQDAHNLAWKLALVLDSSRGHTSSSDALLDSYDAERRPVAAHNAVLSLRNYERSLRVPKALGLDADQAKALAESAAATGIAVPRAVFEGVLAMGRRPLQSLATPGQPYGAACLKAARQVLRDGAGLPLLFPRDDLGFCYDGPLVPLAEKDAAQAERSGGDPALVGFPLPATADMLGRLDDIVAGARMPHFGLRWGVEEEWAVSTTDVAEQLHVACCVGGKEEGGAAAAPSGPFAVLLHLPCEGDDSLLQSGPLAVALPDGSAALPLVCLAAVPPPAGQEEEEEEREGERQPVPPPAAWPAQARAELCRGVTEARCLRLVDCSGRLTRAMAQRGIRAVFVRPDGHVLGVVRQGEPLGAEGAASGLRILPACLLACPA